jgi:hypothetical protein
MTFLFESFQAHDRSIQIVQLSTQLNQHLRKVPYLSKWSLILILSQF